MDNGYKENGIKGILNNLIKIIKNNLLISTIVILIIGLGVFLVINNDENGQKVLKDEKGQKAPEEKKPVVEKEAKKYYIYKKSNNELLLSENKSDDENNELLDTYECISDNNTCRYQETISALNLVLLIDDNKVFSYNVITKAKEYYNLGENIYSIEYAYDYDADNITLEDVKGLIVEFSTDDGDRPTNNYFLFTTNSFLFEENIAQIAINSVSGNSYLITNTCNLLDFCNKQTIKIFDLASETLLKELKRDGNYINNKKITAHLWTDDFSIGIGSTADQQYLTVYFHNRFLLDPVLFLDKSFNIINFESVEYYSVIPANGNITMALDYNNNYNNIYTKFKIYDKNNNLVYKSKTYDAVFNIIDGQVIVYDNGYLNIIDYNEKTIAKSILKITNTMQLETLIIDKWSKDSDEFEINIVDLAITLNEYNKTHADEPLSEEDFSEEKSNIYYTYIYNNKTNTITNEGPELWEIEEVYKPY